MSESSQATNVIGGVTAEQMWDLMSPAGRAKLLLKLEVPAGDRPIWCNGLTATELAWLDSESLPIELLGRLIIAGTDEGWSVDQFIRFRYLVLALRLEGRIFGAAA